MFGCGLSCSGSEGGGRKVVEGVVRALLVVGEHPEVDDVSDFGEGGEGVGIEDFVAEGAVKPLDVCVLSGFAGLDVVKMDAVSLAPGDEF